MLMTARYGRHRGHPFHDALAQQGSILWGIYIKGSILRGSFRADSFVHWPRDVLSAQVPSAASGSKTPKKSRTPANTVSHDIIRILYDIILYYIILYYIILYYIILYYFFKIILCYIIL